MNQRFLTLLTIIILLIAVGIRESPIMCWRGYQKLLEPGMISCCILMDDIFRNIQNAADIGGR